MARLGYDRYGAQGGDWGTSVTTALAQRHRDHLVGIHVNPPLVAPDPATLEDLTPAEAAALADLEGAKRWESGYAEQQATRPQTVGYGLVDSPAALLAWIVEKFRAWTECDGHPENALTRDQMLDDITLYWLTGTAASSARLYWESFREVNERFAGGAPTDTVDLPTGCSIFPKEMPRPSRRWAGRRFTDIRQWHELDRGGHFAAFEQPELYVDEVRSFFRLVR
jgi:pimeloyl-ACP methyl ester carboxylesterase